LDINADQNICHLDLFAHNNRQYNSDFYISILDQDIKDINTRLEHKGKISKLNEDLGLKENRREILDIGKFLRTS
jgi:hypothetical protein